MLKLRPERPETIKEVVKITVPGQEKPEEFTAIFKYRDRAEWLAFMKKKQDDIDAIMDSLVGWEGVEGEFTRENVELVLNGYNCASREIFDAYSRALFRSRVKN